MENNTTTIDCPSCVWGKTVCEWKSKAYSITSEYGQDWEVDTWVEVVSVSCICVYDDRTMEAIEMLATEQMEREWGERIKEIRSFENETDINPWTM